jgi:PAS domain S-box-containing protein
MGRKITEFDGNVQLFRVVVENSLDGVRLIDKNGNIKYSSPSTSKILGYSSSEYLRLNIIDLIHPEDKDKYKAAIQDLIDHPNKTIHLRYRIKHKNRKWRVMEGIGRNFLDVPQINGILSTYQDITGQVEAQDRLWRTNQTLKTIIQASPLAVYVVDMQGRVLMWSKVAEKMFGWKSYEVLGKHLPIVQDEVKDEHQELMDILKSGKSFTRETVRQRNDGSLFDVSISAAPMFDEQRNVISIIAITSDITERRNLEKQKDDFMGIASHELKTPVTSLRAYAQVLERRFTKKNDTESAQLMQKMDAQIGKLTSLIRDLLDVTKIESDKLLFHEEIFPVNTLIDEIIEEVQRTTEEHKIIKKGTTDRKIKGDRDRVGQVLTNLLTNAAKYSPDSDKIVVNVGEKDTMIQVSVKDSGVGIPKDAQKQIFDRFYRVETAHHATIPGIGLGLYISSQIVSRMGGKIWFRSTIGKGTTFYFALPFYR